MNKNMRGYNPRETTKKRRRWCPQNDYSRCLSWGEGIERLEILEKLENIGSLDNIERLEILYCIYRESIVYRNDR